MSNSHHAADNERRAWHLSQRLLDSTAERSVDDSEGRRPLALVPADSQTVATPETTLPLGSFPARLLSGKWLLWRVRRVRNRIRRALRALLWRVRRVRNRIRWALRAQARRAARWIKLHPDLESAFRAGNVTRILSIAGRIFLGRFRRSEARVRGYVPRVSIGAQLAATTAHDHLLLRSVELTTAGEATTTLLSIADADDAMLAVRGPGGRTEIVVPPVDVMRFNPMSFQRSPPRDVVVTLGEIISMDASENGQVAVAQRTRGVLCERTVDDSDVVRGAAIARFACSGVPLIGDLTATDVEVVGADLAAVITTGTAEEIMDDHRRELLSLRTRRAAFDQHSPRGWWSRVGTRAGVEVNAQPAVSVLLPSNRPSDVVAAARSVARQTDVVVQLVVGLHGSHMPVELEQQLAAAFPGDLEICRCDDQLNLGQVMNRLTDAASCDLVSKWDDDDWYSPEHLSDLVRAMEFSGAGLVGKAAEFVYLEKLDLTVRRFATNSERWSTTVAGGTLMLRRDDLVATRWADVASQVDRRLIEDLQAAGRKIYRTHGFGYVLRRRSSELSSHTWAAGDSYFLRQGVDQRGGLDLRFAGFGGVEG